jgi:hypothetical protein
VFDMAQMIKIQDLTSDQKHLIEHVECDGVLCSRCPLRTEGGQCLTTYNARLSNRQLEIDWERVMELYGKNE